MWAPACGRFFSLYLWGIGPHKLALSIKGDKDYRQVMNAYTGMTDRYFRV